jgi:DNA-binding GntR family transcriptional regulator
VLADRIRELVISGSLSGGTRLVEVANDLGVSRQPVREALATLRSEGWLEVQAGRGTFVRTPSSEEVLGLFTVRMALEGEACPVRHAASRRAKRGDKSAHGAPERPEVSRSDIRCHAEPSVARSDCQKRLESAGNYVHDQT